MNGEWMVFIEVTFSGLLLTSQTRNSPLAISIHQALSALSQIEMTTEGNQCTVQQAQGIMDRLEACVKKITDSIRSPAGVGQRILSLEIS